jgi:hypothetical protein
MKKLSIKNKILTSTFLLAALCTSVHAGTEMVSKDSKDMKDVVSTPSEAGFYAAAFGGAQFWTDYGNNHQTNPGGTLFGPGGSDTQIHSFWGGVGGLKFGYKFNAFPMFNSTAMRIQPAVEAEALYIGDNSHASDLAGGGSYQRFTSNSGDFFLNGILRFPSSCIVTPYLGFGVGLQDISTHGSIALPSAGTTVTGLDTNDIDPAVQGLFGFDVAVCRHVAIFTEYKFIDAFTENGHSGAPAGGSYHFEPNQIQQNLITAGVKYSF